MIHGFIIDKTLGNIPTFFDIQRKNFSSKFLFYPFYVFLIFMGIKGAGRINQYPTRLQAVPNVTYDFPLKFPTIIYIGFTPFSDGFFIFSKHAFTRTRDIGKYHIKFQF